MSWNPLKLLRGGGRIFSSVFTKEGNEAKYSRRGRPQIGVDVDFNTAVLIALLSVVLFSFSLPLLWGQAATLSQSFWLSRIVFFRMLGLVYLVAFAVALFQNSGLLGSNGLLPVDLYLKRVRRMNDWPEQGCTWNMLNEYPTLLWLAKPDQVDRWMSGMAATGMCLSLAVMVVGGSNVLVQLLLWTMYHSINTVGQRWYSFGWESQLLETGFISIFMSPLLCWSALPPGCPTPWVCVWAMRWLTWRIMLGAGMIKIRGDSCWRDLTAMCYHYETQPVPNPFSYFLHFSPVWWHKFETMMNHIVELPLPFLILLPVTALVVFGGMVQILFQITLILSGNLSFLNWLTLIPPILCLNDNFLSFLFSAETISQVQMLNSQVVSWSPFTIAREGIYFALCALLVYLSAPVVQNILSKNQVMNTSFGSWKLLNTYGAFGSITREREEVVIEGTYADLDEEDEEKVEWKEYLFKVKPSETSRRPPWISPYHYRLDWLMWFLPFSDPRRNPWLYHLIGKFLDNDKNVLPLIRHNPFQDANPPKFVRASLYLYEYAPPGSDAAARGEWWIRKRIRTFVEPLCLEDLRPIYRQFGWKFPQSTSV